MDEVQLDQRCPDESERQLEGQTEMIRYGNSSYHLIWTRASSTIASAIESIGWCPEEDAPKNSGMEKDLGRAMEGNDASHERSSDSSSEYLSNPDVDSPIIQISIPRGMRHCRESGELGIHSQ